MSILFLTWFLSPKFFSVPPFQNDTTKKKKLSQIFYPSLFFFFFQKKHDIVLTVLVFQSTWKKIPTFSHATHIHLSRKEVGIKEAKKAKRKKKRKEKWKGKKKDGERKKIKKYDESGLGSSNNAFFILLLLAPH